MVVNVNYNVFKIISVSLKFDAEVYSLQSTKDSLTEGNNGFDIIILDSV